MIVGVWFAGVQVVYCQDSKNVGSDAVTHTDDGRSAARAQSKARRSRRHWMMATGSSLPPQAFGATSWCSCGYGQQRAGVVPDRYSSSRQPPIQAFRNYAIVANVCKNPRPLYSDVSRIRKALKSSAGSPYVPNTCLCNGLDFVGKEPRVGVSADQEPDRDVA